VEELKPVSICLTPDPSSSGLRAGWRESKTPGFSLRVFFCAAIIFRLSGCGSLINRLYCERKGAEMAEKVTNELIYEILKAIQEKLDRHERILKDLHAGQIRVREEINSLRGDDLRRETLQAQMDHRLDRIETRLNLSDA